MHAIVWELRASSGHEEEFEHLYGPNGEWVQLFARAAGYIGTELLSDVEERGRYITIDRWISRSAFEAFRNRWLSGYRSLDHRCDVLREREVALGSFASSDADSRRPSSVHQG